jgi:pimeloyl-[acyl-carrier protein] methyl ester esterase
MLETRFIQGFATDQSVWELQRAALPTASGLIVGWSLGGWDAIDLYREVKALVLVSAFARFVKSDDYPYGTSPALLRNLERKLKSDFSSGINSFRALMFNGQELPPIIKNMPLPDCKQTFAQLERLKNGDYRKKIKGIKLPTLIIHGEEDQIAPVESARYLNEKIPGSEIEIFPDCGHAPFLDYPEKFNSRVKEFINKHALQ